jgi:hypothetical protein
MDWQRPVKAAARLGSTGYAPRSAPQLEDPAQEQHGQDDDQDEDYGSDSDEHGMIPSS